MTHELYKTNGNLGLDVMSFDIQRGRDHGLPGYNSYRKYCGLPMAKTFEDFLDYIPSDVSHLPIQKDKKLSPKLILSNTFFSTMQTVKKLKSLYHAPEDVDLLIGGMAERSAEDGILGPTFRCIISEQFARTKRTDRFFYDSINQPHPFSPGMILPNSKLNSKFLGWTIFIIFSILQNNSTRFATSPWRGSFATMATTSDVCRKPFSSNLS